jgi:glycosyltransferase involved in cell wall biosynthesis
LGNVLIEGCMFRKPLITNDIASVLEVNKHGYNGFVAKNWNELINIFNSLPDPVSDEYKRLSYNAKRQYEEYFTLEKMIKNYKELIESIYSSPNK